MNEPTTMAVGTFARRGKHLARRRFVLGMAQDAPKFGFPVSKLTFVAVSTVSIVHKVFAQFRLVQIVAGRRGQMGRVNDVAVVQHFHRGLSTRQSGGSHGEMYLVSLLRGKNECELHYGSRAVRFLHQQMTRVGNQM